MLPVQTSAAETLTKRAPVAVATKTGILVTWRALKADDGANVSYNLYRDGVAIVKGLTAKTNYLDKTGKPGATYRLEEVRSGSVKQTEEVKAWDNMFTTIKVNRPAPQAAANGKTAYYTPDDISVGDLDGDGNYELVLKWMPSNQQDNGYNGYTSPCIIDAYRMDGTQLWRINLGLNIRSGNHYTQFLVYDFDGDGKAEVICKTAPGSKDGKGNYVSKAGTEAAVTDVDNTKTYVNSNGRISGGEEFLTVFNERRVPPCTPYTIHQAVRQTLSLRRQLHTVQVHGATPTITVATDTTRLWLTSMAKTENLLPSCSVAITHVATCGR